jgi:hypothetical protein
MAAPNAQKAPIRTTVITFMNGIYPMQLLQLEGQTAPSFFQLLGQWAVGIWGADSSMRAQSVD